MTRHLPSLGRPAAAPTLRLVVLLGVALGAGPGCQRKAAEAPPGSPPVIPVSHPVERDVTDFADYTGRTDAIDSVSVRARVTGYIVKLHFEEGAEVKEQDLLCEIDPRPYQALVDQARSQVGLYEAQAELAKRTYDRDLTLAASAAASQQQLDQDKAAIDEAKARIKVAQASLETAELNLKFTQVRAPVGGRISRYYYTVGNLVSQDQTLLTTIVSTNPMYVYFDVEERTFQRLIKAADHSKAGSGWPDGSMATAAGGGPAAALVGILSSPPVLMAIEGEQGFPRRGRLNFINNQVNPSTGTVAVRGIFPNTRQKGGLWSLIPGMFVRVRLPLGEPHKASLVIDRAIGSDQGLKFVYVVDAENKVQYRRVVTGPLQDDGLRVIEPYKPARDREPETGVKPDEWVVVGALQQLRPRTEVKPEQIAMPSLLSDAAPTRRRPQPPAPGENKR
ncbi:MAG TPA: efflux RND transporter periplasmic adaptor subunit [Gemmataceae bacterium]|nr:efflux RND transporter periplasmic adaptor subunit [Gemmataceae bacterium]